MRPGRRRVARRLAEDKPGTVVGAMLRWVLALLALAAGPAAAQVPPDGSWSTLDGEHVRVTFPRHLEALGREAVRWGDRSWEELSAVLVDPPEHRVEILLTDHVDVSNGFARVAPREEITVYARPPVDGFALSYFDDWLKLVITHEMAHVFHLDLTGPVGETLRSLFGRVPMAWPFFPGLGTPRWTIEGLATWYESELGEAGRVKGSFHAMVLRTAVLEDALEDVGQVSGGSAVWPAGQRPYVYGSLFFEHLLDAYGHESMGAFVQAVGQQLVPYRLDAAAREAFGASFSEAWEVWSDTLRARTGELRRDRAARAPLTRTRRLTRGARTALHPRLSADGRLIYARSDGSRDPQLRVASADGSEGREWTRTNGLSDFDLAPDGSAVFAQLELADPYRVRSDLYRVRPGGEVERLTRGARLDHPSVAPGGEVAVAVYTGEGSTEVVEVELASGARTDLTGPDPATHWAYPAVSPDGRWIAVSRWTRDTFFDLVILDRDGDVVTVVTRDRAVDLGAAWSPDGTRLIWASDRTGILNLHAVDVDPATAAVRGEWQVTNVLTGVQFPSVSPDGRWIHMSAYHARGWEVERIPYDPSTWFEPFPLDPRFRGEREETERAPPPPVEGEARPYSPLPTLRPRYWQPSFREPARSGGRDVLGPSFGAFTSVEDLVGRHALEGELVLSTSGARPSGGIAYRYAGLGNPLLSVSAAQGWDATGPFQGPEGDDGTARRLWITERERRVSAGLTLLAQRFRWSGALSAGAGYVWEHRTLLDDDLEEVDDLRLRRPSSRLADLTVSASLSSVRSHAFSPGPAAGLSLFLQGRSRPELEMPDSLDSVVGRDRSTREGIGRLRLFAPLPLPAPAPGLPVLALRVSGGMAGGPGADQFHYDVGGANGVREPFTGFSLFGGRSFFFPARGFTNGERFGRVAWSATAELRVPLAQLNQGVGLVPLHLDRLTGSLFVDGANAWGPELGVDGFQNPRSDPLVSVGGEVLVDVLAFFALPLTLRTGVALRLDEVGGTSLYLRLGRSF